MSSKARESFAAREMPYIYCDLRGHTSHLLLGALGCAPELTSLSEAALLGRSIVALLPPLYWLPDPLACFAFHRPAQLARLLNCGSLGHDGELVGRNWGFRVISSKAA